MAIYETSVFTEQIGELLTDDEYALFQFSLSQNPEQGKVIRGTGGARKTRCKVEGQGKRGGARIIYYWHRSEDQIFMLLAYSKRGQANLSWGQKKALRAAIEQEFGK